MGGGWGGGGGGGAAVQKCNTGADLEREGGGLEFSQFPFLLTPWEVLDKLINLEYRIYTKYSHPLLSTL